MKKISEFLSENFQFLVVKFTIYVNRRVFVMYRMVKYVGDGLEPPQTYDEASKISFSSFKVLLRVILVSYTQALFPFLYTC